MCTKSRCWLDVLFHLTIDFTFLENNHSKALHFADGINNLQRVKYKNSHLVFYKREHVGLFPKRWAGSTQIPLLFFTVFFTDETTSKWQQKTVKSGYNSQEEIPYFPFFFIVGNVPNVGTLYYITLLHYERLRLLISKVCRYMTQFTI